MTKTLIINPVVREEDVPRHVPYGLALLAAIAMGKGHMVQVYDANAWRLGEETLREVLRADDWQAVALGGITTAYGSIKSIVGVVREECPAAVIILGGGVLTSLPREVMNWLPEVDVGCLGEGFATFPEILAMIDSGMREWQSIDGTISRSDDGRLIVSKQRALLRDLDSLPYPAWDLFPLEEVYFKNSEMLYSPEGMLSKRRLDVNVSYGCSMICRYCYHLGIAGDMRYEDGDGGDVKISFDEPGKYSRTIRYHSPQYIVRMIKHIYDKYGVDFVLFLDENLMTMDQHSSRVWMKDICRLLHENGLAPVPEYDENGQLVRWKGIYWSGTSHATLCTKEILATMREAGCSHLVYGYESFAPHVLKTVGKGSTPATNERSLYWTLEAGIRPVPNLIIGFPDEDFQSIRDNIAALTRLGISVRPHFATAYPGSEWFAVHRDSLTAQYGGDLEAYILDLGDATSISGVISKNFTAAELIGLRELLVQGNLRLIDAHEKVWGRRQETK